MKKFEITPKQRQSEISILLSLPEPAYAAVKTPSTS
jgi:hypothetical protein